MKIMLCPLSQRLSHHERICKGADLHCAGGVELGADLVPSCPKQSQSMASGSSTRCNKNSELGTFRIPSLQHSVDGQSQGSDSGLGTDRLPPQLQQPLTPVVSVLDPNAVPYEVCQRASGRSLAADLSVDLQHVQQVQAGGVGRLDTGAKHLWSAVITGCKSTGSLKGTIEELPFTDIEELPNLSGIAPKDIHKVVYHLDLKVKLPDGEFTVKVLPTPTLPLQLNEVFTPDYFVALHNITAAAGTRPDGSSYAAFTPNHIGARISLPHTKMNMDRWRHHLHGYEMVEICQLLEFGFPVGINLDQELECKTRNHGSSYMWYTFVDKFITKEVSECGVTGPFSLSPWDNIVISPLMTAHKKPRGRRTVFDATFGELSVNNATPCDSYMGESTVYTYPKVEDFRVLVLKSGRGAYMWKRDLARFYLQLPMDPVDYDKVAMIWRGVFFFFVGLAFGLRHSGLNGQRVTDAVAWILQQLGLETEAQRAYNVVNYVDDMGGVESTKSQRHLRLRAGF